MTQEPEKLIHEGVIRPRKVDLPWDGLTIAQQRLVAKRDANGNIDPHWQRPDGSEVNLTGEALFARATSSLTLTTSDQSITGDGDSSKVRLILPTIGEWAILATCDFNVTTGGAATAAGSLYVNDGAAETGVARQAMATIDRATVFQQWKVTTTAANTPVELKAKKTADVGVAVAVSGSTTLSALIGAGGGSTVETTDHGTLSGLGDDDHAIYVKKSLFNAQTVLAATSDDTPAALSLAEQRIVGRLTGGNVAAIAIGISDNNMVQVDHAAAADNDFAKFTATGLEGRSYAELRTDIDFVAQAISAVEGEATVDLTGSLELAGTFSMGAAPVASRAMQVSDTISLSGAPIAFAMSFTPTFDSSVTSFGIDYYAVPRTEAASFTLADAAGFFAAGAVVGAGSTITNLYGLYVANLTQGVNNYGIYITGADTYALFVDSGLSRFDGDGTDVFELPADATDPTGGGGAAAGRIPVKIGGVTKYIAYY